MRRLALLISLTFAASVASAAPAPLPRPVRKPEPAPEFRGQSGATVVSFTVLMPQPGGPQPALWLLPPLPPVPAPAAPR